MFSTHWNTNLRSWQSRKILCYLTKHIFLWYFPFVLVLVLGFGLLFLCYGFFLNSWQFHWNPIRNTYTFSDSFMEQILLFSSMKLYFQWTFTSVPENKISHCLWGNKLEKKKVYSWSFLKNNTKTKLSNSLLWHKLLI